MIRYKMMIILLAVLIGIGFILPKETYTRIKAAYSAQEVWLVQCPMSLELIEQLSAYEFVKELYPIYEFKAEIREEEEHTFAIYGIVGTDAELAAESKERLTISIPQKSELKEKLDAGGGKIWIGKQESLQKCYYFPEIQETGKAVPYISGSMAEKIVRETQGESEAYNGVCLYIDAAGIETLEHIAEELHAETFSDFQKLKKTHEEGRRVLLKLIFYIFASIIIIESNFVFMLKSSRETISIIKIVKMNGLLLAIVGGMLGLALLDVI